MNISRAPYSDKDEKLLFTRGHLMHFNGRVKHKSRSYRDKHNKRMKTWKKITEKTNNSVDKTNNVNSNNHDNSKFKWIQEIQEIIYNTMVR